jgi:hypothetical protein
VRSPDDRLVDALKTVGAEYSAEVEALREKLREAEERGRRTQAQAELTKVGTVYVISNIGSFGEDVFKVGLTRRLIAQERIDELGDASVPFTFDVHMMIRSDDAPKLEFSLHNALHKYRGSCPSCRPLSHRPKSPSGVCSSFVAGADGRGRLLPAFRQLPSLTTCPNGASYE